MKALRLEGQAGYLVLHHSRIGEQGALMLTRVDVSGKKLWEVDSGITKLDQVLPSGRFLGLVGSSPMRIYSVDLKRGSVLQAQLLE